MKASYREMFDEVRASERLNEEVMNMTKQERTQVVKKVSVSFIIAAALAVLLAGTALEIGRASWRERVSASV